ncbi:MAG TPA: thioredoxin domain-containing protein, partial [Candidatus Eisenbacteria bacterium]|nr:thioredoxin domain-containing protein [Candidatus Eisenbacteria bacterium]
AYLDDYAFLLWGTLELYEATFTARHLETAVRLARDLDRLFRDEAGGGYFFTGTDRDEALLARTKEAYDGALPSGNSMAALGLLRLARMTGDTSWEERARSVFRAFSGTVRSIPSAHTQMLSALDFSLRPPREIVIASADGDAEGAAMAREAARRFQPETVVLWIRPSEAEMLREFSPLAAEHRPVKGTATAYVCENFACRAPVTGRDALARALDDAARRSVPSREGSS